MKKIKRLPWIFLKSTLFAFLASIVIAFAVGIRINTTNSVAGKIWLVSDKKEPSTGDVVSFCPPPSHPAFKMARERHYLASGFCHGGYQPVIKKVMAKAGDTISINEKGIFVNGNFLSKSKPKKHDNLGKILPNYKLENFVLKDGMLLLIGDNSENSFDARYFGIIDSMQIQNVLKPLI